MPQSPQEILLKALDHMGNLCQPVPGESECSLQDRYGELKEQFELALAAGEQIGSPRISGVIEYFAPLALSRALKEEQRQELCMELSLLMCQIQDLTSAELGSQRGT